MQPRCNHESYNENETQQNATSKEISQPNQKNPPIVLLRNEFDHLSSPELPNVRYTMRGRKYFAPDPQHKVDGDTDFYETPVVHSPFTSGSVYYSLPVHAAPQHTVYPDQHPNSSGSYLPIKRKYTNPDWRPTFIEEGIKRQQLSPPSLDSNTGPWNIQNSYSRRTREAPVRWECQNEVLQGISGDIFSRIHSYSQRQNQQKQQQPYSWDIKNNNDEYAFGDVVAQLQHSVSRAPARRRNSSTSAESLKQRSNPLPVPRNIQPSPSTVQQTRPTLAPIGRPVNTTLTNQQSSLFPNKFASNMANAPAPIPQRFHPGYDTKIRYQAAELFGPYGFPYDHTIITQKGTEGFLDDILDFPENQAL